MVMVTPEQSRRRRLNSGDLVDRIVRLRRAVAGRTAARTPIRREMTRLKRGEQALERELPAAVHHRH